MKFKVSRFPVYMFMMTALLLPGLFPAEQACPASPPSSSTVELAISNVSVTPSVFNPSEGEKISISYFLSVPAKSRVRILAPDMFPVKELVAADYGTRHISLTWDGRDFSGRIVPDQAWLLFIEASDSKGRTVAYDPISTNRWELKGMDVAIDRDAARMKYTLPCPAWVNIKVGVVQGGPLLCSLIDWRPERLGQHVMDLESIDVFSARWLLQERKDVTITGSYLKIPDNSVFTRGNPGLTYCAYRSEHAGEEYDEIMVRHPFDLSGANPVRRMNFGAVKPLFKMIFPKDLNRNRQGLPLLSGRVPLKIIIDQSVRRFVINQRLEMLGFVDFKFAEENEEGYSPFTWVIDTSKWPDGKHVLTVNVVTLRGEVAAKNMVVMFHNNQ